jgi:hydroxyacylglutathione hydrolase
VGGCGMFYEGTAVEMVENMKLCRKFAKLMPVFPGHDVAIDYLKYAVLIDKGNKDLPQLLTQAINARKEFRSFVPTTIKKELKYNVFMRCVDADM